MSVSILHGDCRYMLKTLEPESVHCCVTSPPYFGLRDYGVDGQIGLETTPDAFVAELVSVFREVRRVLKNDGVLWLNLGDSYAQNEIRHRNKESESSGLQTSAGKWSKGVAQTGRKLNHCLKAKDLIGIPWAVAKALQSPQYTGRLTAERDRVWLAAILDGEGTINGFTHVRKDDGRTRTGVNVCITNSCDALLTECARIWPASRSEHMAAGEGHLGSRLCERWIPHGASNKADLLAELYPYLISKKQQALVGWNLANMVMTGKSDGHLPHAEEARAKRARLVEILGDLNARRSVDLPDWLVEPPSLFEQGWYLRQDVIWSKPNPMPESVRDRCTKAHEYIFMLTKSARYYFDAESIKEPAIYADPRSPTAAYPGKNDYREGKRPVRESVKRGGFNGKTNELKGREAFRAITDYRNKRSVWEVATAPFSEAHFATFPPALIEPCIKAGCPAGGTVLDPFGGAGTTGLVADRLQRSAILIELNPEYAAMARKRIQADAGLFGEVAA